MGGEQQPPNWSPCEGHPIKNDVAEFGVASEATSTRKWKVEVALKK